jgi:small subunit ribosomal protein S4
MARYVGSICRYCRRESVKLFLKGTRCLTEKCAVERRNTIPGQHGQNKSRRRASEYSRQLREKQKLKRIYGLLERQFVFTFEKAEKLKGMTGDNLVSLLERRLDNVTFRLGLATSRKAARQLVNHGHIMVNGRKVDIASFLVHQGDVVEVRPRSRENVEIKASVETVDNRGVPPWLEWSPTNFKGEVRGLPTKEDAALPVDEQLVVVLYSR